MSEEIKDVEETVEDVPMPDERTLLMQRARMMGLTFSNNIGLETLRQRIAEKMAADAENTKEGMAELLAEEAPSKGDPRAEGPVPPKKRKKKSLRQHIIDENMRLVRCRIVNLDPKKKELPGEIWTVANGFLGTVKKYIPYGEMTDEGFHIPYVLYKLLDKKRFLNIRVTKTADGREVVQEQWAKEFSLEVLPPLTPAEIQRLAVAQKAAGNS